MIDLLVTRPLSGTFWRASEARRSKLNQDRHRPAAGRSRLRADSSPDLYEFILGSTRSGKVFDLTATILTGTNPVYFYNRVEGAEIRWVSYHYHADPELVLPDENLIELLATLTGAAPADSSAPPTG